MNDEVSQKDSPIGLYRDPESGNFAGAIDVQQANAFVRVGFKLVEEGREAAQTTEKELAKLKNPPEHDSEDDGSSQGNKKGNK